ncbi:MAG: MFS transporter [Gammaproteobacteria bacterium]|nr:MFS transporter [Gammaproteobacteria bacterium]
MSVAAGALRRDTKILSLVCAGHFFSHFLTLALPPLIPFWRDDFGLSYTQLGFILTMYAAGTGVAQIPMGFLVDRMGALPVVVTGLVILCGAVIGIGFVEDPSMLLVLALIGGAANGVFHPANYVIMAKAIRPERLGKSFAMHSFSGYLGSALAPVTIVSLAVAFDWRVGLISTAAAGLVAAVAMVLGLGDSRDDAALVPQRKDGTDSTADGEAVMSLRFLLSAPVLKLFLFFVLTSATMNGMMSFSVTTLVTLFDTPLVAASAALTAFLFASSFGILAGGVLADITNRHDFVAAWAFALTAVIIGLAGSVSLPAVLLIGLFAIAGLAQGVIRPARDMMVHAIAPKGATGRVFGFVTTGINVGGALTPLALGWLVDHGFAQWVFWLIALGMVCALGTVLSAGTHVVQAE